MRRRRLHHLSLVQRRNRRVHNLMVVKVTICTGLLAAYLLPADLREFSLLATNMLWLWRT